MKGTEKIIARIESEAEEKAQAIIAGARSDAAAVVAAGEKAAQELYWERIRAGTKQGEAFLEQRKRIAAMETKKSILAAKQEQITKAFELAKTKLRTMPRRDYTVMLARLACEASSNGEEELIFNKKDRGSVGKAVVKEANALLADKGRPAGLSLSEDTRDIMGGFILRFGGIEVNCSVESLVDMQRDSSAAAVAAVLFE